MSGENITRVSFVCVSTYFGRWWRGPSISWKTLEQHYSCWCKWIIRLTVSFEDVASRASLPVHVVKAQEGCINSYIRPFEKKDTLRPAFNTFDHEWSQFCPFCGNRTYRFSKLCRYHLGTSLTPTELKHKFIRIAKRQENKLLSEMFKKLLW